MSTYANFHKDTNLFSHILNVGKLLQIYKDRFDILNVIKCGRQYKNWIFNSACRYLNYFLICLKCFDTVSTRVILIEHYKLCHACKHVSGAMNLKSLVTKLKIVNSLFQKSPVSMLHFCQWSQKCKFSFSPRVFIESSSNIFMGSSQLFCFIFKLQYTFAKLHKRLTKDLRISQVGLF